MPNTAKTHDRVWSERLGAYIYWSEQLGCYVTVPEDDETAEAEQHLLANARTYASDRAEHEECQRSTLGCSIDHNLDEGGCEGW